MEGTRWQKVQTLFHEAADMPPAEQRVFLETRCGDDAALVSGSGGNRRPKLTTPYPRLPEAAA